MVETDGKIKIADFGIAAATDEISVTTTGQVMGTLEYMSPEQAGGSSADGRTDLYSLGMVMYEMLRGQTPFYGKPRRAIEKWLFHETTEFDLSFDDETPPALQDLIGTLLRRNPSKRFLNADALLE